eukprot:767524-Hanusia_phi.AAC.2
MHELQLEVAADGLILDDVVFWASLSGSVTSSIFISLQSPRGSIVSIDCSDHLCRRKGRKEREEGEAVSKQTTLSSLAEEGEEEGGREGEWEGGKEAGTEEVGRGQEEGVGKFKGVSAVPCDLCWLSRTRCDGRSPCFSCQEAGRSCERRIPAEEKLDRVHLDLEEEEEEGQEGQGAGRGVRDAVVKQQIALMKGERVRGTWTLRISDQAHEGNSPAEILLWGISCMVRVPSSAPGGKEVQKIGRRLLELPHLAGGRDRRKLTRPQIVYMKRQDGGGGGRSRMQTAGEELGETGKSIDLRELLEANE